MTCWLSLRAVTATSREERSTAAWARWLAHRIGFSVKAQAHHGSATNDRVAVTANGSRTYPPRSPGTPILSDQQQITFESSTRQAHGQDSNHARNTTHRYLPHGSIGIDGHPDVSCKP